MDAILESRINRALRQTQLSDELHADLMTVRNARGKSITAHAYRFKLVA